MRIAIIFLICLAVIAMIGALVYSMRRLTGVVPQENRAYLDPLPKSLRKLWPLVRFVEHHFLWLVPRAVLARTEEQLRLTGMSFVMTASQFTALSLVSALLFALMLWVSMLGIHTFSLPVLALGALGGFFYPRLWLRDVRKRIVAQVTKQLPIFLDFLTLSVEAGLNINGAMTQAVEKGPAGTLQREFEHVLRDLKAGLSRSEALRRMDDRLRMKEITNFAGAVIQAERMGSGLAQTLRFQSEQRRTERFQRAEKQAMEAPVKLIFPLVVFIFPVTFIVLGFPIVMKFMQEGLL
ncbi:MULTISPECIES: type II secretion system F family protein [Cupriavidus]|uniref:Type II secretion system F family protein n=1 Tax=Cupriavidus pauculus TaxID=82633 RepID=A0A5P2H657_9BURK|nr:type II secretion system F family protein [Cupriavidus pauculus]QET02975.1 type II secretion system F family protein [Cupriavidus pauculus]